MTDVGDSILRPEGRDPWANLARFVPNVGDRARQEFGTYAIRGSGQAATRKVDLRRMDRDQIDVVLFGSRIAQVQPGRLTLFACGYGDRITTREALSAVSFGRGFVCSRDRQLFAGAEVFREGIVFGWDRAGRIQLMHPGHGEPLAGAPARRKAGAR